MTKVELSSEEVEALTGAMHTLTGRIDKEALIIKLLTGTDAEGVDMRVNNHDLCDQPALWSVRTPNGTLDSIIYGDNIFEKDDLTDYYNFENCDRRDVLNPEISIESIVEKTESWVTQKDGTRMVDRTTTSDRQAEYDGMMLYAMIELWREANGVTTLQSPQRVFISTVVKITKHYFETADGGTYYFSHPDQNLNLFVGDEVLVVGRGSLYEATIISEED